MLPQGQSLSYWKAESFPLQWKFFSQVHDRILNDATIIFFEGRWWLFALHEPNRAHNWFLHILYSDSPLGPWIDTPNNCFPHPTDRNSATCVGINVTQPHHRGPVGTRPGGRMFIVHDKLYRVAQNTVRIYGDHFDLYQITSLTTSSILKDILQKEFRSTFRSPRNLEDWSSLRFHHLDLHYVEYPDRHHQWVGVYDGDYNKGLKVTAKNITRCGDRGR